MAADRGGTCYDWRNDHSKILAMKKSIVIIIIIVFICRNGQAQLIPPFKQLRYDEDYSILKNDSSKHWYRTTKFNPLSRNRKTYLSIGGDIRFQYQWFKNENWGEAVKDDDGFMLTRLLVHADLHLGKHFRTFIQLQSSAASGKEEAPSPVDENTLDLHQAFSDLAFPVGNGKTITIRVGRQELLYGSQRLVAVRDGPNNRQSFDAARLLYTAKNWKADLFFSHYVRSKQKIFDDGFNKNTRFWGAYWTNNKIPILKNLDVYYFGLWRKTASFDDGTGKELRHSIGARISATTKFWRYDVEGLYQFGDFANKKISAWTFSVNSGYKFANTRFKPEIGLKAELISGDAKYNDDKLQTFNPLFPRGGYFGLVSLIGPSNLFDIHPSLSMEMTPKLFLNMDYDMFWRYSKNDGIYGPNVAMIYSGKGSDKKSIGRQYSAHLEYVPNNFLYFRNEFTWFESRYFLKESGPGKDILFVSVTAQLRF